MKNIAHDLEERGLVEHTTGKLEEILKVKRVVYHGMDPTAASLHTGHLVPLLNMRRLQDAGHKAIFLVGGGTAMIGDPRDTGGERKLLTKAQVDENKKAMKAQLKKIMGSNIKMVDNADWLLKLNLFEFLRDIGKHFTINELIKRDLIKRRLETPDDSISYTEFTYALLQGYDYMLLNKKYGVDLQIGGTDQWTNMLSGVELLRKVERKEVHVFTNPLMVDTSGLKFSKSLGNVIWLDPTLTSPYQFYQHFINVPDSDVEMVIRFNTLLPMTDIKEIMATHSSDPARRHAQRMLAHAVTTIVHGKDAAEAAARATDFMFGTIELKDLTKEDSTLLTKELPSLNVSKFPVIIADALTEGGLTQSKSEARRLIEGSGVMVSGVTALPEITINQENFTNGICIVRKGKKDVLILVLK